MVFNLKPIGFVRNNVDNRSDMKISGVSSVIEVNAEFSLALDSIEENSHIIMCCFLHQAKRNIQKVNPRKFNIYSLSEKGVFATRSPDRPNPISISVVKLLKRQENILTVEILDVVNNTPVIDIKPYIPENDAIFNCQRLNPKTLFSEINEKLFYAFLQENALKYIFTPDNSLDLGICALVKLAKTFNQMPDRNLIESAETDFAGSALDCLYYHFKFTPGENRIKIAKTETQNSFLKVYFKSGEIWEVKKTNNKLFYPLNDIGIKRISSDS